MSLAYAPHAGLLLAEGGDAHTFLVARLMDIGIDSYGSLVRIRRPNEWPGAMFGDWEFIDLSRASIEFVRELCMVLEVITGEKGIDAESLALVARVFASATLLTIASVQTQQKAAAADA